MTKFLLGLTLLVSFSSFANGREFLANTKGLSQITLKKDIAIDKLDHHILSESLTFFVNSKSVFYNGDLIPYQFGQGYDLGIDPYCRIILKADDKTVIKAGTVLEVNDNDINHYIERNGLSSITIEAKMPEDIGQPTGIVCYSNKPLNIKKVKKVVSDFLDLR